MFPNRMPNYLILEYASNFDAVDFAIPAARGDEGRTKMVTKEGTKTYINYLFDNESGKQIKRIARGFFTRIAEFEYDEKGNVMDEITKDENGTIISRNSFEYNENNLLVFETYFEIDLTHSGRDVNIANRFEYEFH